MNGFKFIDPTIFEEIFQVDNLVTVVDIIDTFEKVLNTKSDSIEALLITYNYEEASKEAHALKSSARTIGANPLADLCQNLEDRSRDKNYDGTEDLVLLMKRMQNHILSELEQLKIQFQNRAK